MHVELSIESMHCERCAANIERYLEDQPKVRAAEVDYETSTGWIVFDADDDIDVGSVVETINAMGYDASVTARR